MKRANQLSARELERRLYWLPRATLVLTMVLLVGFILLAIESPDWDTPHPSGYFILIGSLAIITGWYWLWLSSEAIRRYKLVVAGACQLINQEATHYPP